MFDPRHLLWIVVYHLVVLPACDLQDPEAKITRSKVPAAQQANARPNDPLTGQNPDNREDNTASQCGPNETKGAQGQCLPVPDPEPDREPNDPALLLGRWLEGCKAVPELLFPGSGVTLFGKDEIDFKVAKDEEENDEDPEFFAYLTFYSDDQCRVPLKQNEISTILQAAKEHYANTGRSYTPEKEAELREIYEEGVTARRTYRIGEVLDDDLVEIDMEIFNSEGVGQSLYIVYKIEGNKMTISRGCGSRDIENASEGSYCAAETEPVGLRSSARSLRLSDTVYTRVNPLDSL